MRYNNTTNRRLFIVLSQPVSESAPSNNHSCQHRCCCWCSRWQCVVVLTTIIIKSHIYILSHHSDLHCQTKVSVLLLRSLCVCHCSHRNFQSYQYFRFLFKLGILTKRNWGQSSTLLTCDNVNFVNNMCTVSLISLKSQYINSLFGTFIVFGVHMICPEFSKSYMTGWFACRETQIILNRTLLK